jgi:hypothetical protein
MEKKTEAPLLHKQSSFAVKIETEDYQSTNDPVQKSQLRIRAK